MLISWVYTLLGAFALGELAGYLVHRRLHDRNSGAMYWAHHEHHNVLYPPNRFYGDGSSRYRHPRRSQAKYYLISAAVLSMTFMPFGLLHGAAAFCVMSVWLWLNAYVHDSFHVRGHWLERFARFRKLRSMHLTHHVDQRMNNGILTFWVDRIFKTYDIRRVTVPQDP